MEKKSKIEDLRYGPDNFIFMVFYLVYWAYNLDKEDEVRQNNPDARQEKSRIDKIRYTPFDPALKELWLLHFKDIYTYVRMYTQNFKH